MRHLNLRNTGQFLAAHSGGSMIQNISVGNPKLGLHDARMHNLIQVGLKGAINTAVWGRVWRMAKLSMRWF